MFLTDRASEAMRELEMIKDKAEVVLCATMALIQAHKKAKLVDREAVQALESKLRQDRTNCGEMALMFAGMFLWHTGRHDKAREYVDRMIKMAQNSMEVRWPLAAILFSERCWPLDCNSVHVIKLGPVTSIGTHWLGCIIFVSE